MSLDNLTTPKIEIEINKENWKVEFTLRNFAALKEKFNMNEDELLKGLIQGDIRKIPYAIWASTLVFAPFDPLEPLKIEKELSLEYLFNLSMAELKAITDDVVKAMEAFLPKAPDNGGNSAKKKAQTEEKAPQIETSK